MSLGSTLSAASALLRSARPLGHLAWWTGASATSGAEVRARWARAGLLAPSGEGLHAAIEQTIATLLGVPLLERSGVYWLAPDFDVQVAALRRVVATFGGWEFHTTPVRATADTLEALRSSARRALELHLSAFSLELEALITQPRLRASLLVRRLDAVEHLRHQGALQARHLSLAHEGLEARLDEWARRIDAALCARVVA